MVMDVRAYRKRPSRREPTKTLAQTLWSYLQKQAGLPRGEDDARSAAVGAWHTGARSENFRLDADSTQLCPPRAP